VNAARAGEAISTAFTESAVNQVISKRMVKKQQMRWTPRGAHLLLQVRTRVRNDTLTHDYRRWIPASPTPRKRTRWTISWWRHSSHGMFRSPTTRRANAPDSGCDSHSIELPEGGAQSLP
jgi:hypothetical protein